MKGEWKDEDDEEEEEGKAEFKAASVAAGRENEPEREEGGDNKYEGGIERKSQKRRAPSAARVTNCWMVGLEDFDIEPVRDNSHSFGSQAISATA